MREPAKQEIEAIYNTRKSCKTCVKVKERLEEIMKELDPDPEKYHSNQQWDLDMMFVDGKRNVADEILELLKELDKQDA